MLASAQVPGLINYQGRLTDAIGAPVTGSKSFSLNIYDAATGGNLLYTESIGAVTLDANGIYSFQFGSGGTSNTQVSETVATTNGTSTTFQKVLGNSPVVAGSVSVTDGTYTWSQSAGSSNEDDFGAAYSTSLRRITANYYNGAPAADKTITATYRYGTSGITDALRSGPQQWMAVSVDGVVQGARQRILTVPYAVSSAVANRANTAGSVDARTGVRYVVSQLASPPDNGVWKDSMPAYMAYNQYTQLTQKCNGGIYDIPKNTKTIMSIKCSTSNKSASGNNANGYPSVTKGWSRLSLKSRTGGGIINTLSTQKVIGQDENIVLNGPFNLDHSSMEYFIQVEMGIESTNGQVPTPSIVIAKVENLEIHLDSF
jgi:hypothetical protein